MSVRTETTWEASTTPDAPCHDTAVGDGRARVLLVHNRYQRPGGEDAVLAAEAALLAERGHAVRQLMVDNDDIAARPSARAALALATATVWSRHGYAAVRDAIRQFGPDVVHFHNTFPRISPAGYYAARAARVPVVQTLHNYRLLCPGSTFYRDGHICEDCLGKAAPLPGLMHACYRGSRAATGAATAMLTVHRAMGTWTRLVDRYIVFAEFMRQKFIQGGLPAEKLAIRPNFVPDAPPGDGHGGYALFVGRLSPEKGIQTLLRAWERLDGTIPLRIAGDGPLADEVARAVRQGANVEWLGQLSPAAAFAAMRDAAALIFPSEWYEGQPRTILESFAAGTPVIAPDLGAMRELIDAGETGLHFRPGDPEDLARVVAAAFARPADLARMRARTRAVFAAHYTADTSYHRLIAIYAGVRKEAASRIQDARDHVR